MNAAPIPMVRVNVDTARTPTINKNENTKAVKINCIGSIFDPNNYFWLFL